MAAGFALALVVNVVVGIQMYAYWGKGSGVGVVTGHEKACEEFPLRGSYRWKKVDIVVQPQSPLRWATAIRTST